jgi:hypothetical protein
MPSVSAKRSYPLNEICLLVIQGTYGEIFKIGKQRRFIVIAEVLFENLEVYVCECKMFDTWEKPGCQGKRFKSVGKTM